MILHPMQSRSDKGHHARDIEHREEEIHALRPSQSEKSGL